METLSKSRGQRCFIPASSATSSNAINNKTQAYEAIQELRCIIPPLSPVPDIVVVKRDRLSDEDG
ncbi:MAG: hypothetical protein WA919_15980, partial [Coleofasciculaceae cyanobacterium]